MHEILVSVLVASNKCEPRSFASSFQSGEVVLSKRIDKEFSLNSNSINRKSKVDVSFFFFYIKIKIVFTLVASNTHLYHLNDFYHFLFFFFLIIEKNEISVRMKFLCKRVLLFYNEDFRILLFVRISFLLLLFFIEKIIRDSKGMKGN